MAARQQRISDFDSDGDPPAGYWLELLCEDHNGTYVLPFPRPAAARSLRSVSRCEIRGHPAAARKSPQTFTGRTRTSNQTVMSGAR
jgi:hypothetical protein